MKALRRIQECCMTMLRRHWTKIDQFDVSSALKPSKDEFKLGLQDFKQAGYYGEKGARNYDADDLETSTDYMERAARHMERAADLLPKE